MDLGSASNNLFLNKEFSDVTFQVEGQEFPGHRLILALQSSYFKQTLYGNGSKDLQTIVLSDCTARSFTEVLRFFYLKRIEVDELTIEELLQMLMLAGEYNLEDLTREIYEVLLQYVGNLTAVGDVYEAADKLGIENMKRNCLEVATRHSDELIKSRFKDIPGSFVIALLDTVPFKTYNQQDLLDSLLQANTMQTDEEYKLILQKLELFSLPSRTLAKVVKEAVTESEVPLKSRLVEAIEADCDNSVVSRSDDSVVSRSVSPVDDPKTNGSTVLKKVRKLKRGKYKRKQTGKESKLTERTKRRRQNTPKMDRSPGHKPYTHPKTSCPSPDMTITLHSQPMFVRRYLTWLARVKNMRLKPADAEIKTLCVASVKESGITLSFKGPEILIDVIAFKIKARQILDTTEVSVKVSGIHQPVMIQKHPVKNEDEFRVYQFKLGWTSSKNNHLILFDMPTKDIRMREFTIFA